MATPILFDEIYCDNLSYRDNLS